MVTIDKSQIIRRANTAPSFLEQRSNILKSVAPGEEYRCDPNYCVFYSSQKPKDPRLPPPLFKSHFPGYTQLPIRQCYPKEFQIPPFQRNISSSIPSRNVQDKNFPNPTRPRSADTNDLHTNRRGLESCSCENTGKGRMGENSENQPRIKGGALLAFHISYALKKQTGAAGGRRELDFDDVSTATTSSTLSLRNNNVSPESAGFPKTKSPESISVSSEAVTRTGVEDEDVNSLTCDTADALSLVSSQEGKTIRSLTSNLLPPKASSDEVIRVPPLLSPLVPRVFAGKVSFLFQSISRFAGTVQCSVYRDKKLTGTRYLLMLEVPPNPHVVVDSRGMEYLDCNLDRSTEVFLCAAKRSRTRSSTYIISAEMEDFDKKSINYVAKLRKNVTDNDFTLLLKTDIANSVAGSTSGVNSTAIGENSKENSKQPRQPFRTELLAVAFSPGTRSQPPQIQVVFPSSTCANTTFDSTDGTTTSSQLNNCSSNALASVSASSSSTSSSTSTTSSSSSCTASSTASNWLLQRWRNGQCSSNLTLKNTTPIWNPNSKTFEVDFGKRVTKSTTKNLQLEYEEAVSIPIPSTNGSVSVSMSGTPAGVRKQKRIMLTFGKVEENRFILDFVYPISPIQAFSIALSALDFL